MVQKEIKEGTNRHTKASGTRGRNCVVGHLWMEDKRQHAWGHVGCFVCLWLFLEHGFKHHWRREVASYQHVTEPTDAKKSSHIYIVHRYSWVFIRAFERVTQCSCRFASRFQLEQSYERLGRMVSDQYGLPELSALVSCDFEVQHGSA